MLVDLQELEICHTGFLFAVNQLMAQKSGTPGTDREMTMVEKLKHLKRKGSKYEKYKIWVTGHSLGGAMTKLFGRYLLDMTRSSG